MNKLNIKRLTEQVSRWSTRPLMTAECGRSMVEILGVLAIIGVLSAGALKGYSDAMFKHKMNETIDTVSFVLQRIQELSQKELGEDFKFQNADDIVKYGLLPSCQKENDNECKLPIGKLYVDGSNYFDVMFYSAKECIAFASVHWENVLPVEWLNRGGGLLIGGTGDTIIYSKDINDVSLASITETCQAMCEGGSCYMEIVYGNIFK